MFACLYKSSLGGCQEKMVTSDTKSSLVIVSLLILGVGILVIMIGLTIAGKPFPASKDLYLPTTPGYSPKYNFSDIITGLER